MYDPVEIEVFRNIFQSISDEMGTALRRAAFSPNIKERTDYSCALFTAEGESFSFGSHIPVHLGAMPLSVLEAIRKVEFEEGDMVLLNDPFMGGTHLPDLTLIAPFFHRGKLLFFAANRAHHSDVGGMKPGSMPLATEIYQEGLIIPPVKIVKRGEVDQELLELILANVRTPQEREGDIKAQIAANLRGIERLREVISRYGEEKVKAYASHLIDYTERIFRAFLSRIPDGEYSFHDFLDDDGTEDRPVRIQVQVRVRGDSVEIDFTGSSPQVRGGVNANFAVTYSAVLYVLKCIVGEDVPVNSGLMRPVKIVAPRASVVNASKPAAVAGGNVETSQRIVDVLLGAFSKALPGRIPAASQGTMNNISFGGSYNEENFAYYETIGGGAGAGQGYNGASAVHTHMTNSLNTPVEALENYLPIRIRRYSLRSGSGGKGRFRGGDGIVREYEFLVDAEVSILSERRKTAPYGLEGGEPGKPGVNLLIRGKEHIPLPSKTNFAVKAGDILRIETPGGGGFGKA